MLKKYIILVICCFLLYSCTNDSKTKNVLSENINLNVLFYNVTKKELFVLNLDNNEVINTIDLNIKKRISRWLYKEKFYFIDSERNYTNIYEIDHNGIIKKIFEYEQYFYDFHIINDYLYLLSYNEPFYEVSNIENNFILKYNLYTNEETIIDFNSNLSNKLYSSEFYIINDNTIILSGFDYEGFNLWVKNLYLYKIDENKMEILCENIGTFSVSGNNILVNAGAMSSKNYNFMSEIRFNNTNFLILNINNNDTKLLPYKFDKQYTDFIIISDDYIIYSEKQPEKKKISDILFGWMFPGTSRGKADYYIAKINENKKKLIYSSIDIIKVIGIYNKY